MISDLSDATPEQLLHAAWADLHSGDPQSEPDAVPVRLGGPRLITLGGDGTPQVCDLALLEIAIARHEGVMTTRNALADAVDLRHRGRVGRGARADPDDRGGEGHRGRPRRPRPADQREPGQEGRLVPPAPPGGQVDDPDDPDNTAGIGVVFARLDEADALAHARVVEDLATALAEHAAPPAEGEEPLGMDHWRAEAFAMLADPAAVASPRWSSRSRSDRIETSVPATGTPPRRPLRVLDRVS